MVGAAVTLPKIFCLRRETREIQALRPQIADKSLLRRREGVTGDGIYFAPAAAMVA
jgi:hypothetical protein